MSIFSDDWDPEYGKRKAERKAEEFSDCLKELIAQHEAVCVETPGTWGPGDLPCECKVVLKAKRVLRYWGLNPPGERR